MLDSVKFETICKGIQNDTINWVILINNQEFSYFQGLGHLKDLKQVKHLNKDQKTRLNLNRDDQRTIVTKAKGRSMSLYEADSFIPYAVNPELIDVLHCLFLDSYAHDVSFQDWCDDFGYNNDSISAKKTYDACIDNYFKLKDALGSQFETIKTYIDSLEL